MTKLRTLDRKRAYGTVFGGGPASFEQDGVLFDHEGNELLSDEQKAALQAGGDHDLDGDVDNDDLKAMDRDQLAALATEMGLEFHPTLGDKKLRKLIEPALAAHRSAKKPVDQVEQQLEE